MNLEPSQLAFLIPLAVLAVGLDLFCLVDLIRRPNVKHLPRIVWALIVLASFPFGAILYLVIGRGSAALPPAPSDAAPAALAATPAQDPAAHLPRHAVPADLVAAPAAPPAIATPAVTTPAVATPAVNVASLTRIFASGAGVRDISFTARDRAVTAVIGPNGAGKTVIFSIVAGLLPATSGAVEFSGVDTRVAYCPDVPQFEPWLTALEVVEASLAVAGISPSDGAQRSARTLPPAAALEQCGLAHVANRRVSDFSRGMLQRLGIAAALVLDPDVLILDEPNSALDPIGRADVRALVAEQKQHRCILLSSHMLSEVEQLADDIVVINDGRVVAVGSTTEILTHSLAPVWSIRLGAPSPKSAEVLAQALPEATLEFDSPTLITATFSSFAAAETGLTKLVSLLLAPIIEVTLQDRDLDASFARIIRKQESK